MARTRRSRSNKDWRKIVFLVLSIMMVLMMILAIILPNIPLPN